MFHRHNECFCLFYQDQYLQCTPNDFFFDHADFGFIFVQEILFTPLRVFWKLDKSTVGKVNIGQGLCLCQWAEDHSSAFSLLKWKKSFTNFNIWLCLFLLPTLTPTKLLLILSYLSYFLSFFIFKISINFKIGTIGPKMIFCKEKPITSTLGTSASSMTRTLTSRISKST